MLFAIGFAGVKTMSLLKSKMMMVTVLAILIAGLAGCPTRTSIADINKDPGRYAGKEVTIAGHASSSFGAMGNGTFQIDDGSGHMWVASQGFGVPSDGSKVAVTGRIEQGFSFGGRSFAVVLKETQSRH
jgi:hypothetical protein